MSNVINYSSLTGLYLENFQAIKLPTFIKLNGLVFLYGPNSAGKSAILDAINIFKYIMKMNEGEYYPSYYLPKMSNGRTSSIGLELKAGKLDSFYNKKIQAWENEVDNSTGDNDDLKKFFRKIYDKKIQIEFSNDLMEIKVAVDSIPLFEISGLKPTNYSFSHKKINDDEDVELDENTFWGRLKIYKNNEFSRSLFPNAFFLGETSMEMYRGAYHYNLFVEDAEDILIIKGISFDGNERDHPHPVGIGMSVDSLLFGDFARNISDDVKNHNPDERLIYDMYNKESKKYREYQNQRTTLYWQLIDIVKEVRLLVQGLYFHVQSALEISHVRGDRTLLNSKKPMFVSSYNFLSNYTNENVDEYISDYAEALANKFKNVYRDVNGLIKTDFVNNSLVKYLKSLKAYRVVPEVYDIKARKKEKYQSNNSIVFLYLLDANNVKLGFEDVGSGLSYVMPILSSLWASRFSIVEQPELHLHPKAQCEMADVLIAAFNANSYTLIESHSEHILLRVLKRVRESNLEIRDDELCISNEDVNIYYFEPKVDGSTLIKKIRVDKFGELLDVWPGGFFSEREGELFYE
jgi:predicted ATPase